MKMLITDHAFASVLAFCCVALMWVFAIFKMIPTYRADIFRQRIDELRGELFEFSLDTPMSTNDRATVMLEQRMDSLMNHAEDITFYRLGLVMMQARITGEPVPQSDAYERWELALNDIANAETRSFLSNLDARIGLAFAKHIVRGSPVLLLLIASVTTYDIVKDIYNVHLREVRAEWCKACAKILRGDLSLRKIESYTQFVPI